jgi:hypothetical protein
VCEAHRAPGDLLLCAACGETRATPRQEGRRFDLDALRAQVSSTTTAEDNARATVSKTLQDALRRQDAEARDLVPQFLGAVPTPGPHTIYVKDYLRNESDPTYAAVHVLATGKVTFSGSGRNINSWGGSGCYTAGYQISGGSWSRGPGFENGELPFTVQRGHRPESWSDSFYPGRPVVYPADRSIEVTKSWLAGDLARLEYTIRWFANALATYLANGGTWNEK